MLSVLLPVHNGAGCVGAALESLLAQTFAGFEVIAVENGSSDATVEVLRDWALRDSRIRVHSLPEADIVAALNYGLERAQGACIARMDADDVCAPERFELQMRLLDEQRDTGLVSCLVRHAGSIASQAGYAAYVDWINSVRTHEEIALFRFVESPFAHPSVLFRREIVERLGAWRAGPFPEDYELWLRWLEGGVRMEKVPEVLLDWHDPPGRISRTDPRYDTRAFFACKAGYLHRWLRDAPIGHRKLLFWGAGRETRRRLRALQGMGVQPDGWIDINPRKCGQRIDGVPVYAPEQIPGPAQCFVISCVTNRGAREQIAGWLNGHGFEAGTDYVLAG